MKNLISAFLLLWGVQAVAGAPSAVWIDSAGEFDASRVYSGQFVASGAIDAQGTVADSPHFPGQSIHIIRTMVTSGGEYLVLEINANHVKGLNVVPDWCPAPETIPTGAVLVPESGNWRVLYGTGKYSALTGTGSFATWVVLDPAAVMPLSATECMDGGVKLN